MCAACGEIVDDYDAAGGDEDASPDYDATVETPDAAAPDAAPIACTDDRDCVGKVPNLEPCEEAACIGDVCGKRDLPDESECEDGDLCTTGDTCTDGECIAGVGTVCDNGVFCDGVETCNPSTGGCESSSPPTCSDGVGCTTDFCDSDSDGCVHVPDDGACDNGLFCDGTELCDLTLDCIAGLPACNDGIDCTSDTCDEGTDTCDFPPIDGLCDNGEECDGMETCDPSSGCVSGSPPTCDDSDPCTIDECVFGGPGCSYIMACGPGDSCVDPFYVDTIPFFASDDTTDSIDDYFYSPGECFPEEGGWGTAARDEVWELSVPSNGTYAFELRPDALFDSNLYVIEDCTSDGDFTCLGGNEEVGNGVKEYVPITLFAGQKVHVVVDGWSIGAFGPYDLAIAHVGDVCIEPIEVGPSLPFTHFGDTTTTSNFATRSDYCTLAGGTPGPEAVYSFMPPADGIYEIRLSGSTPRPNVLYVTVDCAMALGCVAHTGPTSGDQVLTLSLSAGTTYYIFVDAATSSTAGRYMFSVQSTGTP